MMPSGSVNSDVFGVGAVHPYTQLAVVGPLLGSGVVGVAGGVGEAVGDPGLTGAGADVDDAAGGVFPTQADKTNARSAETQSDQMNLRKPSTQHGSGTQRGYR